MAEFVGGDVVVVPFPFTDLQASKRRPAVVLAAFVRGDLPLCQITSRSESDSAAVAIDAANFMRGGIDRPRVALRGVRCLSARAAADAGGQEQIGHCPSFFEAGTLRGVMIDLRDIVGEEWAEWYRLTPLERIEESSRLWETYLELGGSFDPEPDSQSPFYDPGEQHAGPADGRPGVRVVWRGGI